MKQALSIMAIIAALIAGVMPLFKWAENADGIDYLCTYVNNQFHVYCREVVE